MTDLSDVELLSVDDLRSLREPEWLVTDFIHKGDVAVLYGPPSSGKSFLAIDLALSVALGLPWLGRYPVASGAVLYMAGEGGPAIFKRVDAWMEAREVTDVPWVRFHLKPLPLRETEAVEAIEQALAAFDHQDGDFGLHPCLVVIDTLSQFFSGGDEVSPDMTQFVSNMRQIARNLDAAVLIVHHTNVGGERERGHTSLRCNVEVMFKVVGRTHNHQIVGLQLTNDKQKDDAQVPPLEIVLAPSRTSLVVTGEALQTRLCNGLVTGEVLQVHDVFLRNLLLQLVTHESKTTEVVLHNTLLDETGWSRMALHRRLDKLKKLKLITGAGRGKSALTLLGRNTADLGSVTSEN